MECRGYVPILTRIVDVNCNAIPNCVIVQRQVVESPEELLDTVRRDDKVDVKSERCQVVTSDGRPNPRTRPDDNCDLVRIVLEGPVVKIVRHPGVDKFSADPGSSRRPVKCFPIRYSVFSDMLVVMLSEFPVVVITHPLFNLRFGKRPAHDLPNYRQALFNRPLDPTLVRIFPAEPGLVGVDGVRRDLAAHNDVIAAAFLDDSDRVQRQVPGVFRGVCNQGTMQDDAAFI